jgi:DNA-3-methyladenine glycosylase II
MNRNTFYLEPRSPFRLDLTAWTLRRRPDNVVDRWDGQTYRRVLPCRAGLVEVAVTQAGPPETARVRVTVGHTALSPEVKQAVTAALERLLGLRTDLEAFYSLASRDAVLGPLAQRFRGMKPPRFATVFESVLTAIASQQVTRTLSVLLLNRLALNYGAVVHEGESAAYAFPRAEDLATMSPADLRQLGFSLQKGRAMIELSRSIIAKDLDLEGLAVLPDAEAIECLCGLRGLGRWSAEYVLLRGLGRTHIFPGDDVGARKNLERWLNLVKPLDYAAVHRTLKRWHPYAGLVYFHLLLDRLEEAGFLATGGSQPQTRYRQPSRRETCTEDQTDETRVQSWRSCGVELGSRPRSGNNQEKGHFRHQV